MRIALLQRRAIGALCTLACALTTTACGDGYAAAVRRQHAALYGCSSSAVATTRTAGRTYVAHGCGRRAAYICRRGAVCAQQGDTSSTAGGASAGVAPSPTRTDDARARADAAATAIRANPRSPEVGGTRAEARALCDQQSGTFVATLAQDQTVVIQCTIGGLRLFAAHESADTGRLDQVDTFIEGASLPDVRARLETQHGPGAESVSPRGMRRWAWCPPDAVRVVQMYDRGVWLTSRARSLAVPATEPSCPASPVEPAQPAADVPAAGWRDTDTSLCADCPQPYTDRGSLRLDPRSE